jgi:hypothetical protein
VTPVTESIGLFAAVGGSEDSVVADITERSDADRVLNRDSDVSWFGISMVGWWISSKNEVIARRAGGRGGNPAAAVDRRHAQGHGLGRRHADPDLLFQTGIRALLLHVTAVKAAI